MIQEKRKRFAGKQGVTLYFKAPKDLPGVAKEFAGKLGIKEYMASASNGQAKLLLRWSESVESLSKRITFGKVTDSSELKREIRIEVNGE